MSLSPRRLESLDALRGLTIAAMLLVNNPGSWSHIYWPLEHAAWNGWTFTDLVFSVFLVHGWSGHDVLHSKKAVARRIEERPANPCGPTRRGVDAPWLLGFDVVTPVLDRAGRRNTVVGAPGRVSFGDGGSCCLARRR